MRKLDAVQSAEQMVKMAHPHGIPRGCQCTYCTTLRDHRLKLPKYVEGVKIKGPFDPWLDSPSGTPKKRPPTVEDKLKATRLELRRLKALVKDCLLHPGAGGRLTAKQERDLMNSVSWKTK